MASTLFTVGLHLFRWETGVWLRSGVAPHSLNSHTESFKPHLEDLTLPLPYTHMSQRCPLPHVCCSSWSAVGQSFVSKTQSFALSGPGRGVILAAFIGAAGSDKLDWPLVDGERKWCVQWHKLWSRHQSHLTQMCFHRSQKLRCSVS